MNSQYPIDPSLGRRARQIREQQGLSTYQLAQRSGVCEATIKRFERGLCSPTSETMRLILAGLGARIEIVLVEQRR